MRRGRPPNNSAPRSASHKADRNRAAWAESGGCPTPPGSNPLPRRACICAWRRVWRTPSVFAFSATTDKGTDRGRIDSSVGATASQRRLQAELWPFPVPARRGRGGTPVALSAAWHGPGAALFCGDRGDAGLSASNGPAEGHHPRYRLERFASDAAGLDEFVPERALDSGGRRQAQIWVSGGLGRLEFGVLLVTLLLCVRLAGPRGPSFPSPHLEN